MHSLYPKLHEDEILTSTPATTDEYETSLSSLLVKQSLFYWPVCVKVAAKAQPSVMGHIMPDLA